MHRRKDLPGRNPRIVIVLPAPGIPLGSFVAAITAAQLISWNTQLQSTTGFIALPRFTATYGISLPAALTALGMGNAFCTVGWRIFQESQPIRAHAFPMSSIRP